MTNPPSLWRVFLFLVRNNPNSRIRCDSDRQQNNLMQKKLLKQTIKNKFTLLLGLQGVNRIYFTFFAARPLLDSFLEV